jgi:hypothetical protein
MSQSKKHLEVYFTVDHPVMTSAELEQILLSPPDEKWDVGQQYFPGGNAQAQTYKFSRWSFKEKADSLDDLSQIVAIMGNRIRAIEGSLRHLPSDATKHMIFFVDETDTVLGFGFDAETLALLGKVGAGIEISLVVG